MGLRPHFRIIMNDVTMLIHTHKSVPFNFDSSWVKLSYATCDDPNEWHPYDPRCTNVYLHPAVKKLRDYYSNVSEVNFLKALGQQVTDLYLAETDTTSKYLGVGSYRRYLAVEQNVGYTEEKLHLPMNEDVCKALTSESQKNKLLYYLNSADVVCSRFRYMHTSIENQYLESQLPEYWFLFKEAIVKLYPEYAKHTIWFTDYSLCNYECIYVMGSKLFKQMVHEYFTIMDYIWKNCSEVFPDKNTKSYNCTEPLPWRYPGFINERFVPFFMYANRLRKIEVPLAFLQ